MGHRRLLLGAGGGPVCKASQRLRRSESFPPVAALSVDSHRLTGLLLPPYGSVCKIGGGGSFLPPRLFDSGACIHRPMETLSGRLLDMFQSMRPFHVSVTWFAN